MKAFTLIELMLMLGVIALTLALSIIGLTRFRASIELNTTYTNVVSFISEIKNKSTNAFGTTTGGVLNPVDLFAVSFNSGAVSALDCDGNFDFTSYSCVASTGQSVNTGSVAVSITGCDNRIGFKRLTGDLVALNVNGAIQSSGVCTVQLQHSFTNELKTITIDLVKNTYK